MKKKTNFEGLDDFSKFFRNKNYFAYKSGDTTMLMDSGSTSPVVIMISPERVAIHRGEDKHFYSCKREKWGPDFLEKCGYREYENIAKDYRSYQTLDELGKFLVDECGMRIEGNRLKPKCCQLEQTIYDAEAYYTLTISLREDREHFDLNMEISPFKEEFSHDKKYSNWTDWGPDALTSIGKNLPIPILTDYVKKYKKYLKQKTREEYEDYEY